MVGIERRIKAARASPASEKTIVADGSVGSEVQAGKGLDRVRVAHFVQRYPPALGGSEAYFARLGRYLAARGDDVTVFTTTAVALEAFWDRRAPTLPPGVTHADGVTIRRYGLWRWPAGATCSRRFRSGRT